MHLRVHTCTNTHVYSTTPQTIARPPAHTHAHKRTCCGVRAIQNSRLRGEKKHHASRVRADHVEWRRPRRRRRRRQRRLHRAGAPHAIHVWNGRITPIEQCWKNGPLACARFAEGVSVSVCAYVRACVCVRMNIFWCFGSQALRVCLHI